MTSQVDKATILVGSIGEAISMYGGYSGTGSLKYRESIKRWFLNSDYWKKEKLTEEEFDHAWESIGHLSSDQLDEMKALAVQFNRS